MPVEFDPSNLNFADPYVLDLEKAALNWRTPKTRSSSMCQRFLSASTQVSAGSQEFNNLGPYVMSEQINKTALITTA
jgi:hypothetical protein